MKTSQFIGAAVLSILGVATGAQAETYQGVQSVHSVNSRAEVAAQGRAAARAGDAFSDASYSGVTPALNSTLSRASVRAEAAEAARQGDTYGEAATYRFPAPTIGQVGRAAARNAS